VDLGGVLTAFVAAWLGLTIAGCILVEYFGGK
jgi:hypothetical protein